MTIFAFQKRNFMKEKVTAYLAEIQNFSAENNEQFENFRIKFLSKKGIFASLYEDLKTIPNEQKRDAGKLINDLKNILEEKLSYFQEKFENKGPKPSVMDLSLPGNSLSLGSRHPISKVKNELCEIFIKLGFSISEGPEIEDDWHVFSALNFPIDHPARDMQDTFFFEKTPDILLRTHTSSVQVRAMESSRPPLRIIMPGRVFRNEAISARAHCIFHQIEGLYIDKNVSFADLKQTLLFFAKEMFGEETKIRLRPSYFPFTEPSAEMDVTCKICKGTGCNVCKHTGWLEVLGCGMVDPKVLENCNIDPNEYSGFAFGMGIERIAMLKYSIKDLRLYFENDVRFLKQFV
jgi:phenylalanyl-tRNA synthetase alpha chain